MLLFSHITALSARQKGVVRTECHPWLPGDPD